MEVGVVVSGIAFEQVGAAGDFKAQPFSGLQSRGTGCQAEFQNDRLIRHQRLGLAGLQGDLDGRPPRGIDHSSRRSEHAKR